MDTLRIGVGTETLQDFAEDEVGETEALAVEFAIEPRGLGIAGAGEIVDPDGGVDDDHT